jgi:hypothetical protein
MHPARPQKHAGPLVVARPRQRIVAPLPGDRVRAVDHAPAHDDARADARAENDAEDDLRTLPGPIRRLRKCEAVGVVRDAYFAPERARQVLPYRFAVQIHRIGAAQEAGRTRDRAGRADAHRCSAGRQLQFAFRIADQCHDGRERRGITIAGRGHAPPQALASRRIQRDDFDLGTAQVQPQADGLAHRRHLRFVRGRATPG